MRSVVVDANVFVSFFIERHEAQRAAARALLQSAEDGEIAAAVPQSVVFEVAYVLQSQYGLTGAKLATIVHAVTTFPGMQVVNDCSWKRLLEIWPDPVAGLTDAAIITVATTGRHEAVATFDQKLAKRMKDFGLSAYW